MTADPNPTKGQDEQRLKSLFEDLEKQVEETERGVLPVDVPPVDVSPTDVPPTQEDIHQVKQNETPAPAPAFPKVEVSVCPFLKASWDKAVIYQYPNDENWCYRVKKARPVSLEQQEQVCYDVQWQSCPIHVREEGKGKLPALLRKFL